MSNDVAGQVTIMRGQAANLLGSLLISHLQLIAMARNAKAPTNRVPFFLIVDEFQMLSSEVFASLLAEG